MRYAVYYNYKTIGDILLIVFKPSIKPDKIIKNGDVTALYKDDELVGINIFDIGEIMKIHANGLIPILTKEMLKVINNILKNSGLDELEWQNESGFKIAKIVECEEHPESEHLHVLKVDIGEKELLDIVCGAKNAREGLICVCATPYTFMPNGEQIIPSKLLGIQSNGMLCSARELHLDGDFPLRGLLELDDKYSIGSDFFQIM